MGAIELMRKLAATSAVALLLAVASCATDDPSGTTEEVAGSNSDAEVPEATPAGEPDGDQMNTSESTDDGTAQFGEQVSTGGIAIKVSKPKPYTPGRYAAFDKAPAYVSFTIVLVNNSGERYDPASGFFQTLQSGNREAGEIFSENIGGSPSTTVLPGREVKWRIAYGVKNPKDLVMEVEPKPFEAASIIYTTS